VKLLGEIRGHVKVQPEIETPPVSHKYTKLFRGLNMLNLRQRPRRRREDCGRLAGYGVAEIVLDYCISRLPYWNFGKDHGKRYLMTVY
jgi:hypothetical protein